MLTIELGLKYSAVYTWIKILSMTCCYKRKKKKKVPMFLERLFPEWIYFYYLLFYIYGLLSILYLNTFILTFVFNKHFSQN